MRKLFWIGLVIVLTMLLSACGQQTAVPATETAASQPVDTGVPVEEEAEEITDTQTVEEVGQTSGAVQCKPYNLLDDILAAPDANLSPISETDHVIGPEDARMTILEFSDIECPYCQMITPLLTQFQAMFPDDVRMVYRHFPLSYHDKSQLGSQATEAAGMQGKFWEMLDAIYLNTSEWGELTPEEFAEWLDAKAAALDLDVAQFQEDIESDAVIEKVESDVTSGRQANITGTPTVYLNGGVYSGNRSIEVLSAILDLMKLEDRQYTECPPMVIDTSKTYTATLKTEKGDIVIELYDDEAPVAVNSFVFLAREGWFDNVIFHRVLSGFVAQAGDPLGLGYGGPGYAFSNEINADLSFDSAGIVGMANSGPENNGSQFFITYDALPDLNGNYTVFGKVIEGMDVAESLTARDPSQGGDLPQGDKILSVVIEEK